MASLFSIADEVAVALGFTHDDSRLNRIALAYYVQIAVDKANSRRLTKDYSRDLRGASDNLERFIVDLQLNDPNIPFPCMYFDLPATLLSLPFDGGLAWVRYHRTNIPAHCPPDIAGRPFNHTTIGALSNLYNLAYKRPEPQRPYVARDRYRVYVFGVNDLVTKLHVGLFLSNLYNLAYKRPEPQRPYVARDRYRVYVFGVNDLVTKLHVGLFCSLPDMADMDPDAELPLPPDVIYDIRRMVLDSARLALLIPERLQNDGRDLTEPVRTEKQVSINDPINIVDMP